VTRDANPGEAANRASNVTFDGQTVEFGQKTHEIPMSTNEDIKKTWGSTEVKFLFYILRSNMNQYLQYLQPLS
jgi:hypothetical protein